MMGDESRLPFQDEWYAQIPNLHSWLRGDRSNPFLRTYPHQQFEVDFWFAPFYLMRVILGWKDCSQGIAHLLTETSALAGPVDVLGEVWGARVLGPLGWWAWKNAKNICQSSPGPLYHERGLPERFEDLAGQEGFTGGWDPKHLTVHLAPCIGPLMGGHPSTNPRLEPEGDAVRLVQDHPNRHYVLLLHRYEQWPQALATLALDIPEGPPSWRIHVVTDDLGSLGEFRRCWDWGVWFQGPARFHQWGHSTRRHG